MAGKGNGSNGDVGALLRKVVSRLDLVVGELNLVVGEQRETNRRLESVEGRLSSMEGKLESALLADRHIRERLVSIETWARGQGYRPPPTSARGSRPH